MACALPVLGQTEGDGIPDFLLCPICLELPEKVFQCKEGHPICGSCYVKYVDCPNCRSRFDKAEPFRNRYFEGLLDKVVKVDCAYKINGCTEKPTRELVHVHQTKCLFNIDKFGKMVNLCKLLDYKACDFRFNIGNMEDAVDHLLFAHGCVLTGTDPFQMKLTGFLESTEANPVSNCFWTPVISALKEGNGFLFTCAMLNVSSTARALTCFSLIMPMSKEVSESLTMEYSVSSDKNSPVELGFFQKSMLLSNVESILPNNLPFFVQTQTLKSHLTEDGSLLLNCKVLEGEINICSKTDAKVKKLERIVCSKRTISKVSSPACTQSDDLCGCNVDSVIGENIMKMATSLIKNLENDGKADDQIIVENLPQSVSKDHIKGVFSKFGEIRAIYLLKLQPNGNYLVCDSEEGLDSCIVEFVCPGSVSEVMERKRRIFMRKNGKKHRLNVKVMSLYKMYSKKSGQKERIYFCPPNDLLTKADHPINLNGDEMAMFFHDDCSKMGSDDSFKRLSPKFFFMCARNGDLESVKLCIKKGCDVTAVDFFEESNSNVNVLALALLDKDKKIGLEKIKFLVESGADIHFKTGLGRTLLHLSVLWGRNDDAVKFFLEKGLNVNAVDVKGETPLHSALLLSPKLLIEKVKILLDHGASLNMLDKNGLSPLHYIKTAPIEYRDLIEEMFKKHLNA